LITAYVIATSNVRSQWESQKFDPHCSHIFNGSFWNSKPRTISGIRPGMQNLVDVRRRERGLQKWRILTHFWFFLFLYNSPRVQITT